MACLDRTAVLCRALHLWLIASPLNLLLFLMLLAIVISGAWLFMMLCPSPADGAMGWGALRYDSNGTAAEWTCVSSRNATHQQSECRLTAGGTEWDSVMEALSQLMNGLFTAGAIINAPSRIGEAFVLYRGDDAALARIWPRAYGTPGAVRTRRRRWCVVALLLANCLGQAPITAAHWFFPNSTRPKWVVPIFLPVCFGSAIAAAVFDGRFQRKDGGSSSSGGDDAAEKRSRGSSLESQLSAL